MNKYIRKGELKILGSGTSQGIPVITCECPVCCSKDKKDKRLRTSALLTFDRRNIVIDTGPDFRYQMLRENVKNLDGVLITHQHKDHIAGMDDVRSFNFKQNQSINVFSTLEVQAALKKEFHYAFSENKYPGVPKFNLIEIDNNIFYPLRDIGIIPIEVIHHKMPVKGFRIGDLTYITDAKKINPPELEKIMGSKILIINALRISEHISHFNLSEALDVIKLVNPQKAFLTHISHLLGKHEEISKQLPKNVHIAYDGLTMEFYY